MSKLPYVLPEIGGDRFGFAGSPGQTHPRAGRTAPETIRPQSIAKAQLQFTPTQLHFHGVLGDAVAS